MRILALILLTFSFLAFSQKKQAAKLDADAAEFYRVRDYKKALELYIQAEKLCPSDPHYTYSVGHTYMALGFYKEAIPYLIKVKESKIKTSKMIYDLGKCYHATMQFDNAIKEFQLYKEKALKEKNAEGLNDANNQIRYCENAKVLVQKPQNVKIQELGDAVNTSFPEYNPVITADELIMMFTARRKNTTGNQIDPLDNYYYEDIYLTVRSDKSQEWSTPMSLSNVINTKGHDACVGLAADGHQLFIYKTENGGDLYVSNLLGTIWSEPKNLGTDVNSEYQEASASISANGKYLFFASDRPNGKGGFDIYLSKRLPSGDFGPPLTLSDKINSQYHEFSPFIHHDGKTLYFSSKGRNSMGGYDIFSCTINPETGEVLSEPVNVGFPINTTDDDVYFVWSADNKRAYYASVREEGKGEQDLYMLEREDSTKAELVVMKGKITNCINNDPVHASLTVTNHQTQEVIGHYTSNSITGRYIVVLPGGFDYGISIEAPGFGFSYKNIQVPAATTYYEINDTTCLQSLRPGEKIVLKNVAYEENSAVLKKESEPELNRVAEMLQNNQTLGITIGVHTSDTGDDAANTKLTEERSKTVRDYLIAKGLPSKRIFYKGFGETKPLVPNTSDENRKLNERTEIEILR